MPNNKTKYFFSIEGVQKKLRIKLPRELTLVEKVYPVLIPEYYLSLIDKNNIPRDPIWKQSMPDIQELQDAKSCEDSQNEKKFMPVSKLVHRYIDRALVLTTARCAMQCRFCFRKRQWKKNTVRHDITDNELENIRDYLKSHPEIKEVLLSGGDPLMLTDKRLAFILHTVYSAGNIEVVRIASRAPVTLPSRINKNLVNVLSKFDGIWFVTHFNHPNEITAASMAACKKIISAGIPMLNQTVLLKGINDDPEVLKALFRKLVKNKIKPYYLFHVDPERGVKHFATGIAKGLEIIRYFRKNLSSIAVPHFCIDLPEGGGKVSLQPSYTKDGVFFESVEGDRLIAYYPGLK